MKNEVFSGKRFWTYFKYDLSTMWHSHFKAALGIGLAGLFFYVVAILFNLLFKGEWLGPGLIGRYVIFILAGAALELYQTRTYGYITDKRKGSAWLMLPASTFEKWLSMMIMTLIVIPLIFLVASFAVDELLVLLDPTMSEAMFSKSSGLLLQLNESLEELNEEYMTNWSSKMFIVPTLFSFCSNFLFFLLCGLCFRKNKILWAFLILFGLSVVSSIFTSTFMVDWIDTIPTESDLAGLELRLRQIFNLSTILGGITTVGLAGGCYYRLKTIKH